jgi:hypothetical protein
LSTWRSQNAIWFQLAKVRAPDALSRMNLVVRNPDLDCDHISTRRPGFGAAFPSLVHRSLSVSQISKAVLIQPFRRGAQGVLVSRKQSVRSLVGVFDNNPAVLAYSPT